jgi:hypothetical protein
MGYSLVIHVKKCPVSRLLPRVEHNTRAEILRGDRSPPGQGGIRRRRSLRIRGRRSIYVPDAQRGHIQGQPSVEDEVAELRAQRVKFKEYDTPGVTMKNSIMTGGGAKTAWFKDTEGNILAISQRL